MEDNVIELRPYYEKAITYYEIFIEAYFTFQFNLFYTRVMQYLYCINLISNFYNLIAN